MTYRVELTDRAVRDLEILYQEKNAAESLAAARWFNGLEKAVCRLERYPLRCPMAPESRKMKRALRHLLYGKKPYVYRVIFEIDEPQRTVWVLTIRHAARKGSLLPLLALPIRDLGGSFSGLLVLSRHAQPLGADEESRPHAARS
jgi:mRNA-degrading endonuclease RelE of RelBE toxin-antitoxin system